MSDEYMYILLSSVPYSIDTKIKTLGTILDKI